MDRNDALPGIYLAVNMISPLITGEEARVQDSYRYALKKNLS